MIHLFDFVLFGAVGAEPLSLWGYHDADAFEVKPLQLASGSVATDHLRDVVMGGLAVAIQFGVCLGGSANTAAPIVVNWEKIQIVNTLIIL